jgi:hypothetical protein
MGGIEIYKSLSLLFLFDADADALESAATQYNNPCRYSSIRDPLFCSPASLNSKQVYALSWRFPGIMVRLNEPSLNVWPRNTRLIVPRVLYSRQVNRKRISLEELQSIDPELLDKFVQHVNIDFMKSIQYFDFSSFIIIRNRRLFAIDGDNF